MANPSWIWIALLLAALVAVPSVHANPAVLDATGSISGSVFRPDGATPLANADVWANSYDGGGGNGYARTDDQGRYTITGLPAGDYRVESAAGSQGYVREYYKESGQYQQAARVSVVAGQTTTGIDFTLEASGSISGKVTKGDGVTAEPTPTLTPTPAATPATAPTPISAPTPTPTAMPSTGGGSLGGFTGEDRTFSGTTALPTLGSIVLAPANASIREGQSQQFVATGTLSNGTAQDLTTTLAWSSSDAKVAAVGSTGQALGLAAGTTTISAKDEASGISSTANLLVTPALASESTEQKVILSTTSRASADELADLQRAVAALLGTKVTVAEEPVRPTATEKGMVVTLKSSGQEPGQHVTGDLTATLGNLTLKTTNARGTTTLALGEGLSVESDVRLEITNLGIEVIMEKPKLKLAPRAPEVATLAGGNPKVTVIGVAFDLGLKNLPDGASISVQFAKDATAFVQEPVATFQLAAQGVGGIIEDLSKDVAFVVKVTKVALTNRDLADNTATMTVSKAWYDEARSQGKDIFVIKIDDARAIFTVAANCSPIETAVTCTTQFVGNAGGFSVFAFVAIAGAAAPTTTSTLVPPTPTPLATPTRTSTLVPTTTAIAAAPASLTATNTPSPAPSPTPTAAPMLPTPTPAPFTAPQQNLTPAATPTPEAQAGGLPIGIAPVVLVLLVAVGGLALYVLVIRRRSG